ncbi:MAG: hypothetical protein ABIH41_06480 [Nanoarchaeota archaeon]
MSKEQLIAQIEETCFDVIRQKGWRPFKDVHVDVLPQDAPMGAHITLDTRRIHIYTADDLYDAVEQMRADEGITADRNTIIDTVTRMMMTHEYGHHRHCPRTNELFQNILHGSFEALEGREYRKNVLVQTCLTVHNLFSDTILNTINAHTEPDKEIYRQGIDLFFLLAWNSMHRKTKNRGDKAIDLHANINQVLCTTDPDMQKKLHKYMPRIFLGRERHLRGLVDVFTGDKALTKAALSYDMSTGAIDDLVGRLQDTSLWRPMATEYTDKMYRFIKTPHDMYGNSFSRPYMKPPQGGQSKQQQGQGQPQDDPRQQPSRGSGVGKNEQNGQGDDKKDDPANDQANGHGKDDDGKKDNPIDKDADGHGKDEHEQQPEAKPTPVDRDMMDELYRHLVEGRIHKPYESPMLTKFDRLDRLYRERAGRIIIIGDDQTREQPQGNIHLSREEIDLDQIQDGQIDWASTRVRRGAQGRKRMELYRRDIPEELPLEQILEIGGIPDLSWIFDSSISMEFNPFEGDGSGQYHLAAVAFYSVQAYLEQVGLANLVNQHMMNFSLDTRSSGWCGHREIERCKKTLFDYQGGGTFLKPNHLRDLRVNRRDNFVNFMLSDTDFNSRQNTADIIQEFDQMLDTGGIGLYLFQLGPPTIFSEAMKERGVYVQPIKSAEDFLELSIQITKDLYAEALQ